MCPIGIVAVFFVMTFLHDTDAPSKSGTVDWLGIGLLAMGLGTMQYVLEEGERNDWFQDSLISTLAVISAVSLVTLVWWQLSRRNPAPVDRLPRAAQPDAVDVTLFLFVVLGFGIYGGTYLFPLLAQTVLGFTSMQTGLALLPGGIATGVSILVCGALLNRPKPLFDIRWIIVFGTLVTMVSMWQLGHLSSESGTADTTVALLLRGLGTGFLFVPINQVGLRQPEKERTAAGVGPAQPVAAARRLVRHRPAGDLRPEAHPAAPGRSARPLHAGQLALHRAPAGPGRRTDGARHGRCRTPSGARSACWNRA